MLETLQRYVSETPASRLVRDALDIALVYYLCFRALLVLRGTRAMQVGMGMAAVFAVYLVAHQLQLMSVVTILGALISSIILVIVVVFQSDIRRGLMRVGSSLPGFSRVRESAVIDEVVDAATELARHRIGAIIAFEQEANLDEFVGVNKGCSVDAAVTTELLVALFIPEGMNKLHDGAVIIRDLRVAKAGVFFPLSETRVLDQSFGSRHRAAIGITEETDAVVVVVSEERGTISYCFNGNIAPNLDGPRLRSLLESVFDTKPRKKKRPGQAPIAATVTASEAPGPAVTVGEQITLPLRPSGEVPQRLSREPRPVEAEPARSVSQPPPPLRPRTLGDAATTPRSSGRNAESESRTAGQTPVPLRPRPATETDPNPSPTAGSVPPPPKLPSLRPDPTSTPEPSPKPRDPGSNGEHTEQ